MIRSELKIEPQPGPIPSTGRNNIAHGNVQADDNSQGADGLRTVMFLELFHGRPDPSQEMDDWGEPGPIFACPNYVHTTYACDIKLGEIGGQYCDLKISQDGLVYYDGMWYGDWSVFVPDEKTRQSSEFTKRLAWFDPAKATPPPLAENQRPYTVVGLFPPDPDWDSSSWDASFIEQVTASTPDMAAHRACWEATGKRLIGRDENGGVPTHEEIRSLAGKIEVLAVINGFHTDIYARCSVETPK